jgi:hypothetical protein
MVTAVVLPAVNSSIAVVIATGARISGAIIIRFSFLVDLFFMRLLECLVLLQIQLQTIA